jgi:hypothetical protein
MSCQIGYVDAPGVQLIALGPGEWHQLQERGRARCTALYQFPIYIFGSGRHSMTSTDWPGKIIKCG